MNELAQFLAYVIKVFALNRAVRAARDSRPYAKLPTRALLLSLLLGVVVRAGSYLDLSKQTKRRRWQHLIHWRQRISDDAFDYGSERFNLVDLRQILAEVNQRLKANKALESCKINGLLCLSLDANEHFKSRSRCCRCCCQREIQETDAQGQTQTVIEYYHRYVFAQINGPKFNVLLDLEPIRPGEEEAQVRRRTCPGSGGLPAGENRLGEVFSGHCSLPIGRRNKEDFGTAGEVLSRRAGAQPRLEHDSAQSRQKPGRPEERRPRNPPCGIAVNAPL